MVIKSSLTITVLLGKVSWARALNALNQIDSMLAHSSWLKAQAISPERNDPGPSMPEQEQGSQNWSNVPQLEEVATGVWIRLGDLPPCVLGDLSRADFPRISDCAWPVPTRAGCLLAPGACS